MPEYIERDKLFSCLDDLLREDLDVIRHYPLADVVPVQHGKWLDRYVSGYKPGEGVVSSCCDMWNNRKSDFCPNCGAKMDKED